jgi:hypothetical protein
MADGFLEYTLNNGYIHNWLVAGPRAVPVDNLECFAGDDLKLQIARHYYRKTSDVHQPPIELGTFQVGEQELAWRYQKCLDDHFVDLSASYPVCHYLRAWAYAQVMSPAAGEATLVLTTNGPADVWLNRAHVHRQEHLRDQEPHSVAFQGTLQEGRNEILVRFEATAVRDCPFVMALQIVGMSVHGLSVQIPTWHTNIPRRHKLERLYQQAHVERAVLLSGENVVLRWDDEIDETGSIAFWVQDWREHIQSAGEWHAEPAGNLKIGSRQFVLDEGPYRVALTPPSIVIERYDIRHQEYLPFHVLKHAYADTPYGTLQERSKEALEHAAKQGKQFYAEIAKLALGRWGAVDRDTIRQAATRINQHQEGSVRDLVGLLGIMHRHPNTHAFPQKLKQAITECVLNGRYWHDEPGSDIMCYTTEDRAILFHTCEILAGQLYPDRTFANAGQSGLWHREKGERLAIEWLHARGTTGFEEWDSNSSFDQVLSALSHLHDLAENSTVRELAAVVMDKLFFTMAVNSFNGIFGSTHGRTDAQMIVSGQLEATSPISRLMWGMGVWNHHIMGAVSLACSGYELPPTIPYIAADQSDIWHKEQHPDVNKVTYRTRDYMLSSAQDYCPGEQGREQHIWQATMGPDAVVFVNHPSCTSKNSVHRPNFWRGNGTLPRVAQWKDVLIAVHKLPQDDWMGFTHAYMPVHDFDEFKLDTNWAFARHRDAYLALTASQGIKLVTRGPSAFRELRSYGKENTWLCHMGHAATDTSFEDFRNSILSLDVKFDGLSARCGTLRGQTLSFGGEGPLRVDGKEQPLSGFKHYDGPFCTADLPARQMDINYAEFLLQLDFDLGGTG